MTDRRRSVILVHGLDGSCGADWFPWIHSELSRRQFKVIALKLPSPGAPRLESWISCIASAAKSPNTAHTYFVAHSLGCISVARYIGTLPERVQIGGCVFVAGFSASIGSNRIEEFTNDPLDGTAVRKHCVNFEVIASRDDPVVTFAKSVEFQKAIGATLTTKRHSGHFDVSFGVTKLREALGAILRMASYNGTLLL